MPKRYIAIGRVQGQDAKSPNTIVSPPQEAVNLRKCHRWE